MFLIIHKTRHHETHFILHLNLYLNTRLHPLPGRSGRNPITSREKPGRTLAIFLRSPAKGKIHIQCVHPETEPTCTPQEC